MQPNQRVSSISLSATLALDARAKELAAEGRDIVNLTAGEPDFDSPESVRTAAKKSIDSGMVRYTPASGRPTLRDAVAEHLSETRGVPFTREQVTVTHSCKHAISGTLLALIEEGDEILVPLPAWVSYFDIIKYAGGVAVGVKPTPECAPDPAAIEAAVTPKTRGILLNSPSNPSGYVWTEEETRAVCAIAEKHDLWIVSDEIYRRLVFDGPPMFSPVQVSPEVRARTIIVDGASKAYAMTGYRIGFLAGDTSITSGVARLHSQLTGRPLRHLAGRLRAGPARRAGRSAADGRLVPRALHARRQVVCVSWASRSRRRAVRSTPSRTSVRTSTSAAPPGSARTCSTSTTWRSFRAPSSVSRSTSAFPTRHRSRTWTRPSTAWATS